MKKLHLSHIIAAMIALQFLLTGCAPYFKAISTPLKNSDDKAAKIDSLNKAGRHIILRNGFEAYYMTGISINPAIKSVECTLDPVATHNKLYLPNAGQSKMRYKQTTEGTLIFTAAQCYIHPDNSVKPGKYVLACDKVQKIELIEKDKRRTTNSRIAGGAGIALGLLAIAAVIALASFKGLGN